MASRRQLSNWTTEQYPANSNSSHRRTNSNGSASVSSSLLFDAPFTALSSSTSEIYDPLATGTAATSTATKTTTKMRNGGGLSSATATTTTTPLRRRENDAFAAFVRTNNTTTTTNPTVTTTPTDTYSFSSYGPLNAHHNHHSYYFNNKNNNNRYNHHHHHHAELPPFQSFLRTRQDRKDKWLRYTMRGVLLSPLIVLVIWTAVALFSVSHTTSNNNNNNKQFNSNQIHQQLQQQKSMQLSNNNINSNQNENQFLFHPNEPFHHEGLLEVVEVMEDVFGKEQPITQHQQQQQIIQPNYSSQNQVFPALGVPNSNSLLIRPRTPPRGDALLHHQQQPMSGTTTATALSGVNLMQPQPPLPEQQQLQQQKLGAGEQAVLQHFGTTTSPQLHPQLIVQPPILSGEQAQPQQEPPLYFDRQAPALPMPVHHHNLQPIHHLRGAQPMFLENNNQDNNNNDANANALVFYYNPAKTVVRDGRIVSLPDTVYDSHGQPLSLTQALQPQINNANNNQNYNPVWIQVVEPKKGVFHKDQNETILNAPKINITYYHPNTVHTPVHDNRHHEEEGERKKGNFLPDGPLNAIRSTAANIKNSYTGGGGKGSSNGGASASSSETTNPTDQSILVGTVGTLALLVGALSARRMRNRALLSTCIENESLQDDAAYDTAYTIDSRNGGGSYNTFAQDQHASDHGWKGDLEKFDV